MTTQRNRTNPNAFPRPIRWLWPVLAIAIAGAWDAPLARAQSALGDGRALDANPLVGSGGRNTRVRSIEDEVRFRNAIVTGNVAGGFAFRDFVGYSAAGDFEGELASDDLFEFERDSLFSGLAARNVRGINALQSVMALSTGGLPDPDSAAVLVERSGRGAMGADFTRRADDFELETVSPFTGRPRSIRSTSDHLVTASSEPSPFAMTQSPEGDPLLVISSPLRGVFVQPMPGQAERAPSPDLIQPTRQSGRIEPDAMRADPLTTRIEPIRSTYDNILRSYGVPTPPPATPAEPGDDAAPARPSWAPDAPPAEPVQDKLEEGFMARIESLRRQLLFLDEPAEGEDEATTRARIGQQALDLFGETAPRIDRFVDPAENPGAYTRHMADGQRMLGEGRWFDAEQAFTNAMMRRPGDPVASIGRAHAQLGAGMLLSSAVNLRAVLRAHPEMIAVRYAPELLPREPRRSHILDMLRTESQRNDGFGRDAAFLLAYAGHQFESREDVDRGLRAIERIDRYLSADPDPLVDVLRAVWLKD